ncbi:hypothetical protein CPB85DRAFT_1181239, partial [Mucidula mucida]
WDLNLEPNVNSTGHLIFDTVSAFLQHWPNTRYRNGHNLIPGVVPVGTLLYHGRGDANIPTEPQWTATDPEHSYAFCRGSKEEGCWQLTVVATRPLNVLYFDGSSAAKMIDGPMDTQDIVAWGKIIPEWSFNEKRRLEDLCAWGVKLGLDGFVRMEMDFEIMLCDFRVGVEVASFLNLKSNGRREFPPRYPPPDPSSFANNPFSEVIHSGSWHNKFPGDTRIQLDYARIVSFYDTALVPSLISHRFGQERWYHRLDGISEQDAAAFMVRLEQAVTTPHGLGSGVDWTSLVHVIVDRYANRLEMIRYLLNDTDVEELRTAKRVQTQLKAITQPYNLNSAVPVPNELDWASPIYEWCSETHTKYIVASLELTVSEQLILDSLYETNKQICRVATKMWAQGVLAGLDDVVEAPVAKETPTALLSEWRTVIDKLMAWLDWSVWITCRPACAFEEYCYLPTWPF